MEESGYEENGRDVFSDNLNRSIINEVKGTALDKMEKDDLSKVKDAAFMVKGREWL